MKRTLAAFALTIAGLSLGGCYDDGYGYGYGGVSSAGSYPYGGYNRGYDGYRYNDRYYRPAQRSNWREGRDYRRDRRWEGRRDRWEGRPEGTAGSRKWWWNRRR